MFYIPTFEGQSKDIIYIEKDEERLVFVLFEDNISYGFS